MSQPSAKDTIDYAVFIVNMDAVTDKSLPHINPKNVALARAFLAQQKRIERLEAVVSAVKAVDHETWCDILNNISPICNCVLSDVDLALKELNSEQA